MKILSIDVGIKNLAFCLFEKSPSNEHFKITKWDIINLCDEDVMKCVFVDKQTLCNKPAKFKKNDVCYCAKHSKKQTFQIPTTEQKPSFVNKQKLSKLYEMANTHSLTYEPKIKKTDLINVINEHIKQTYFDIIETKKADEVNIFNIGIHIKHKFNHMFKDEGKIDYVIIENQIGPLAIRMKTIQGMLVQYFIMSTLDVEHIEFISASNKLKDCDVTDKVKYSDRKKLGIAKCLGTLTVDFRFNEHLEYFNAHKKRDDLSDAFLQGLWFINHTKL